MNYQETEEPTDYAFDLAIKFGNWMHIHSTEATNTISPCRYYKNKLLKDIAESNGEEKRILQAVYDKLMNKLD